MFPSCRGVLDDERFLETAHGGRHEIREDRLSRGGGNDGEGRHQSALAAARGNRCVDGDGLLRTGGQAANGYNDLIAQHGYCVAESSGKSDVGRPRSLPADEKDRLYWAACGTSPGRTGMEGHRPRGSLTVTQIIVKFEGFAGRYVWHCHLLEHEDNEMMRPYIITPCEDVAKNKD